MPEQNDMLINKDSGEFSGGVCTPNANSEGIQQKNQRESGEGHLGHLACLKTPAGRLLKLGRESYCHCRQLQALFLYSFTLQAVSSEPELFKAYPIDSLIEAAVHTHTEAAAVVFHYVCCILLPKCIK